MNVLERVFCVLIVGLALALAVNGCALDDSADPVDEWTIQTTMTAGGSQTFTWITRETPSHAVVGTRYVEATWQFTEHGTGDEIVVPVDKTIITKRTHHVHEE